MLDLTSVIFFPIATLELMQSQDSYLCSAKRKLNALGMLIAEETQNQKKGGKNCGVGVLSQLDSWPFKQEDEGRSSSSSPPFVPQLQKLGFHKIFPALGCNDAAMLTCWLETSSLERIVSRMLGLYYPDGHIFSDHSELMYDAEYKDWQFLFVVCPR